MEKKKEKKKAIKYLTVPIAATEVCSSIKIISRKRKHQTFAVQRFSSCLISFHREERNLKPKWSLSGDYKMIEQEPRAGIWEWLFKQTDTVRWGFFFFFFFLVSSVFLSVADRGVLLDSVYTASAPALCDRQTKMDVAGT